MNDEPKKTKHTPGPWQARTFMVMGGKDMRDRICHVGTSTSLGPPRSYETEANARLIGAAPDLLDAAKTCLAAEVERRKKLRPGAPATTYCENRIAMISAAIAKAETA